MRLALVVPLGIELSDDLVRVRPFETSDRVELIRRRDSEFRRFLGEGSAEPSPTACITVSGTVVGWIDCDDERDWLADDEVNVGYGVFAGHRGMGYATRALGLLTSFLQAQVPPVRPTLLIDPANTPSLAVADRAGYEQSADINGQRLYKPATTRPWTVEHLTALSPQPGADELAEVGHVQRSGTRTRWVR